MVSALSGAVLVQQHEERLLELTVADGTTISGGTILQLTDPTTGSASSGNLNIFAGIAANEKLANDGSTRLAVWRKGVFDMYSNDAANAGDIAVISGANMVGVAKATLLTLSGAALRVGTYLQSATAGEVIEVLVGG